MCLGLPNCFEQSSFLKLDSGLIVLEIYWRLTPWWTQYITVRMAAVARISDSHWHSCFLCCIQIQFNRIEQKAFNCFFFCIITSAYRTPNPQSVDGRLEVGNGQNVSITSNDQFGSVRSAHSQTTGRPSIWCSLAVIRYNSPEIRRHSQYLEGTVTADSISTLSTSKSAFGSQRTACLLCPEGFQGNSRRHSVLSYINQSKEVGGTIISSWHFLWILKIYPFKSWINRHWYEEVRGFIKYICRHRNCCGYAYGCTYCITRALSKCVIIHSTSCIIK